MRRWAEILLLPHMLYLDMLRGLLCDPSLKLEAEAQCLYTVEEVGQEVTKKKKNVFSKLFQF